MASGSVSDCTQRNARETSSRTESIYELWRASAISELLSAQEITEFESCSVGAGRTEPFANFSVLRLTARARARKNTRAHPELQHEALDHFICFGKQHFDHIVSEYVQYYRDLRPHQGIGNVLLPKSIGAPAPTDGEEGTSAILYLAEVKCEQRLGGLLKHFYRAAA